jgi:phytoene dehydrogenase-like protein
VTDDVAVVGAGHNGLAAAAYLARAGLEVLVVEERDRVGGAASTEELVPGFRFSTCAYALHLLHERVVDELALELDVIPLPPRRTVLPDGTVVCDDELDGYEHWNALWEEGARAVDGVLLGPPRTPERPMDSVADLLARELRTPLERAVLAPTYLECDPREAGSALTYAYMESGRCRPDRLKGLPRGGMGTVADAFARAARAAGARIVTGFEGDLPPARVLMHNVDPSRPPLQERPAGAKLFCALREAPDVSRLVDDPHELGLVHVLPSLDWWEGLPFPREPLVEIQIPTFLDRSLVDEGHTVSLYVPNAPRGLSADDVLACAEQAIPNLRDALVGLVFHGPSEIGNIHHLAHAPTQMYGARPGPRTSVPGVYLCGAGTHPGGEVSGVPGRNAAHAVLDDLL